MFRDKKKISGTTEGSQKESVSPLLLALINMILEGPTITDHHDSTTPAALSITQLIKFNSIECKRKEPSGETFSARHSVDQETPVPMYIGLMLHGHTRKKELVDRLYHLGLSISLTVHNLLVSTDGK